MGCVKVIALVQTAGAAQGQSLGDLGPPGKGARRS